MKISRSLLQSCRHSFLPVIAVTFTIAGHVKADLYWDGTGGLQTFTNAANWNTAADGTGVDPASPPGSNDIASFNITGSNVTPQFRPNGYGDIGGIVVNSTGGVLFETSIINGIRNMGLLDGGITINSGAGTVEFGESDNRRPVGLVLKASQTWTNNGAGNLIVWNHFAQNPNLSLGVHTLTIDGSSNTIIEQRITGTGGIIKNGAGALTLDDDALGAGQESTFSGTTTVNAGTLNLYSGLALQNSVLNHMGGTETGRQDSCRRSVDGRGG